MEIVSDRPKYWAFLSYSHRDARWGSWLHKALESYRPPRPLVGTQGVRGPVPKRLTPIFRDREELASSTDLGASINEALNHSACQIVICSPSSARSHWVNQEILAFKRLGREDRIFCLIVDGEPNASDNPALADQECFPPALRYRLGKDGELSTVRTEPIAADARPGKDGRNNAKLKLIAGILGVGFDALRQRDLQRRQRQMFAIASGALAGMVITSGLAAAALMARTAARRETVIARREAETARQTTDFLVGLFKDSDPSEARGNKLTAREVLDKGASYIGIQLAKQPEIQARLLDALGTTYKGLGLYGQAKTLLAASVDKQETLRPQDPGQLAVSLTHIGDLLTLQAQYPEAEKAYRRAIALQRSRPDDQRDDSALARSLYGLGDELANSGDAAAAEASLREALKLQQRLFADANPDTALTLQLLAWAVHERDLNEAIGLMESAVAMQRKLWGSQPYPDYSAAVNDLGLMLRDRGDYEQSERLLRESLAMQRPLFGERHPALALSLNNLAQVLWLKGDLPGAEAIFREALAMQRGLLGDTHPDVANTLNNLAFVIHDRGDVRGALQTEGESLAIYRKLFPGDNPDVARIMNRLGYWYTETHDFASADRYLQESLRMRQHLFDKSSPEIASSLAHIAIYQVAIHNYQDGLNSSGAALEIYTAALSASNWKSALAESINGAALAEAGRYDEAERRLLHGYGILSRDSGTPAMYRQLAAHYLEEMYRSWGRPREAMRYAAATAQPAAAVRKTN